MLSHHPNSSPPQPEMFAPAPELIIKFNNIAMPTKNEIMILAVGAGKAAFSSGMVLRDTYQALGEPMSVTTLHRGLDALAAKGFVREIGAMIDDVSGRPTVGYGVTEAGDKVLRHYAAAA